MATTITLPAANDNNWATVLNTAITTVRDATDAEPAARNAAIATQHTADNAAYDAAGAASTAQSNAIADAATKYMLKTHMVSTGAAPTMALGGGAGTAPSNAGISGTDTAMTLTFQTGAAPAPGTVATITFATAWTAAPKSFMSAKNAPTAAAMSNAQLYLTTTTTTLVLSSNVALGTLLGLTFDIFVVA